MGKLTRKATIEAVDPKVGMTAGEIVEALSSCPSDMVPTFLVRMNGAAKKMTVKSEYIQHG